MGPGGLTRERAGFELETFITLIMEGCVLLKLRGSNIGLISSLAMFAEVNNHGFIESPYREL